MRGAADALQGAALAGEDAGLRAIYVFSDANMECQKAVLHTHQGTASNVFYLRPEDVEKIMNNQEHFIQTFKKSLQPLLTGEPLFLQEELTPSS